MYFSTFDQLKRFGFTFLVKICTFYSGILPVGVVVCVLAPAYTSLCRGLEYWQKVRYIIVVDPNGAAFLIVGTIFLGRTATLPYVWKTISQKWAPFAIGSTSLHQTFTEYVSNQYTHFDILICQMRLQVMEQLLILLCIFWVFSYIIDKHSCLKYCIFTKLSQIVYLIDVHVLLYEYAKCNCWLCNVLSFFCIFIYY